MELDDWKRLPPWVDTVLLGEGIRRENVAEIEWQENPRRIAVRLKAKPQDVQITISRPAS